MYNMYRYMFRLALISSGSSGLVKIGQDLLRYDTLSLVRPWFVKFGSVWLVFAPLRSVLPSHVWLRYVGIRCAMLGLF